MTTIDTVPVSAGRTHPPFAPSADILASQMDDDFLSAVRKDAERVLEFCELRRRDGVSIHSAIANIAIHDSRVPRKQSVPAEPVNAQQRDDQRTAELRRAIYARPADPKFDVQGGADLYRVVPLRMIANIVRSKGARSFSPPPEERSIGQWLSTISTKMSHLDHDEEFILRGAALLNIERFRKKDDLARVDAALGSAAERQKLGRDRIAKLRESRGKLARHITTLSHRRRSIVHRDLYSHAMTMFIMVCSLNQSTMEYDQKTLAYCLRWSPN